MTNATAQPEFRPFNPEGEMRVYVRNLPHWQQHGATYFVTILLPNHVHALLISFGGWELEDLLGSIKKWTSRHIGNWLEKQPNAIRPAGITHHKPRFWQHESYDRIVRDVEELVRFRKYIADNPSKANLRSDQFYYYAADWLDQFAPRMIT